MNELQQRIFSKGTQDTLEAQADRRREPRTRIDRPVYVRPAGSSGPRFEEVRAMRDFSRSGFYFITQKEFYREGMQLNVIPAFSCFNFEYVAEVVRIERLPFGDYGIAVRLLRMGNDEVSAGTTARSVFQSFALVGDIPSTCPTNESESSVVSAESLCGVKGSHGTV